MAVDAERLESLLELLRANGGRVTAPRRAILSALLETGSHVTAPELADVVQQRHPDVHLTTIYRTLETLADLGVIAHVHLGHGRAVFHMADEAHQHLVCERCGTVVEVPDEVFADLGHRIDTEYGFKLHPDHFALGGLCRQCQASAPTE